MPLLDFAPSKFKHLNKDQEQLVKALLLREDFRKAVRLLRSKYKVERLQIQQMDDNTAAILFSRIRDSELGEAIFWMMGELKIPFSELFPLVCLLIKHDLIWKPQLRDTYPLPTTEELQGWEMKFKEIDTLFAKGKNDEANKLIRRYEKAIYRTDRLLVSLQYRHVRILLENNARQEDILEAWDVIGAYQKFFRDRSQRSGDFDLDAKLLYYREEGRSFPEIAEVITTDYVHYLRTMLNIDNLKMEDQEKIWKEKATKLLEEKYGKVSGNTLRVRYHRLKQKEYVA